MRALLHVIKNGKFVVNKEGKKKLEQYGLYSKKSVYTALRTYEGKPFELERHLNRLLEHGEAMELDIRRRIADIRAWVLMLIAKSPKKSQFIKIIVTPDDTVLLSYKLDVPPWVYKGVRVKTFRGRRNNPKIKSFQNPEIHEAWKKERKKENGAFELLLVNLNSAILEEGAKSNILWVKDSVLYWTGYGLDGVTERIIRNLAEKLKIPLREGTLRLMDLADIDELMITQSSTGVVPIKQVEDDILQKSKIFLDVPGPLTKKLMKGFEDYVQQNLHQTAA